jgi:hypothetical protein
VCIGGLLKKNTCYIRRKLGLLFLIKLSIIIKYITSLLIASVLKIKKVDGEVVHQERILTLIIV